MKKLLMLLVVPLVAIAMMLGGCCGEKKCNTCNTKYISSDSSSISTTATD